MSTTAIPSALPEDLLLNAENLDKLLNSSNLVFTNRLGEIKNTIAGLFANFPNSMVQKSFANYASLKTAIDDLTIGTNPCNAYVIADESNANQPTYYLWSGSALQWIPTVNV